MSKIRSKQIADFKDTVDWSSVNVSDIPSTSAIKEQFLAQEQLIVEDFTGNSFSSSSQWTILLENTVKDNDSDLVTIYVNGVKTNGVISAVGEPSLLTIKSYGYDIDGDDEVKVHYIKSY